MTAVKKAKPKDKKIKPLIVQRKLVDELRLGDRMATSLHEHSTYGVVANKTVDIKEIDMCEGRWRTHVHINGTMCWDLRSYVYVVI